MYQLSILDKKDYHLLDNLAERVSLGEKIDTQCVFIQAKDKDILAGVVGFNLSKEMPRLEHIICDIPYQRTRLGVILLKEMEKYFREKGYKEYYSYILNGNKRMISYARKWKMQLTKTGERGSWFTKELKG